jgi:hypothetical protein
MRHGKGGRAVRRSGRFDLAALAIAAGLVATPSASAVPLPPRDAGSPGIAPGAPVLAPSRFEPIPSVRDEIRLDGLGVRTANPGQLFPRGRSRETRPLVMRRGTLLDRFLELPRLDLGSAFVGGPIRFDAAARGIPDARSSIGPDDAFDATIFRRLSTLSPIPEPQTALLAGAGLVALARVARRRLSPAVRERRRRSAYFSLFARP